MSNSFNSIRETIYTLEAQIATVSNNLKDPTAKRWMDTALDMCQQISEYVRSAEKREAEK
jgi:hypothetical protein